MRNKIGLLLTVFLLTTAAFAQRTTPASKTELAQVTARGRLLFEYDIAAWHSSDAVRALSPPQGRVDRYVARKTNAGWTVAYGKLNEKGDKFLTAYEAVQGATPQSYKVTEFATPKADADYTLFAARAMDTAQRDFGRQDRAYNVAAIPGPANEFYVYLMPAQTKAGVFPLGGDVRYRVSGDGLKILEKRRLHQSIIEFSAPKGTKIESGYHTAILDNTPEDTDVFHVLARTPKAPELIVTPKFVYRVNPDGSAEYLKTVEAFRKDQK